MAVKYRCTAAAENPVKAQQVQGDSSDMPGLLWTCMMTNKLMNHQTMDSEISRWMLKTPRCPSQKLCKLLPAPWQNSNFFSNSGETASKWVCIPQGYPASPRTSHMCVTSWESLVNEDEKSQEPGNPLSHNHWQNGRAVERNVLHKRDKINRMGDVMVLENKCLKQFSRESEKKRNI